MSKIHNARREAVRRAAHEGRVRDYQLTSYLARRLAQRVREADAVTRRAEQIREESGCSWEAACARAELERDEPATGCWWCLEMEAGRARRCPSH